MFLQVFHLYRAEGSQPHMKGYIGGIYAFSLQLLQEIPGKMESCRWGSGGSFIFGIYRLVTVFILKLMSNIGRKGHFPQLIQHFFPNSLVLKADQAVSFLHHIQNLRMKQTFTKYQLCARSCFLTRFNQGFPDIIVPAL